MSNVKCQMSNVKCQMSDVKSQMSDVNLLGGSQYGFKRCYIKKHSFHVRPCDFENATRKKPPCNHPQTPPLPISCIKVDPRVRDQHYQLFQSILHHCRHYWCDIVIFLVESESDQGWVAEQQFQPLNVVVTHLLLLLLLLLMLF